MDLCIQLGISFPFPFAFHFFSQDMLYLLHENKYKCLSG